MNKEIKVYICDMCGKSSDGRFDDVNKTFIEPFGWKDTGRLFFWRDKRDICNKCVKEMRRLVLKFQKDKQSEMRRKTLKCAKFTC